MAKPTQALLAPPTRVPILPLHKRHGALFPISHTATSQGRARYLRLSKNRRLLFRGIRFDRPSRPIVRLDSIPLPVCRISPQPEGSKLAPQTRWTGAQRALDDPGKPRSSDNSCPPCLSSHSLCARKQSTDAPVWSTAHHRAALTSVCGLPDRRHVPF